MLSPRQLALDAARRVVPDDSIPSTSEQIQAAMNKARSLAAKKGYKRISTPYGRGYHKEGQMTFKTLPQFQRQELIRRI